MTQLEKTTIKTQTAVILLVSLLTSLTGGLTAYFSTTYGFKDAMREMQNEFNLKIMIVENKNNIQDVYIENMKAEQRDMKDAIVSYIGTGLKPDETQPEEKTFKQRRR